MMEQALFDEPAVAYLTAPPSEFQGALYPSTGDVYEETAANPIHNVSTEPVSTFSIDVDTAAYANTRRFIESGQLPPADAVRVEELINYFNYAYAPPVDSQVPFAAAVSVVPSPWNQATQLVHIGIQGYDLIEENRPAANLTFLVDISGSMDSPDKLGLLVQGLRLLVGELGENDTVAIVTYASGVRIALPPTPGSDKAAILGVLDGLRAGGSTSGEAGLETAYNLAYQSFNVEGVNRILLATDGDFNVGISDPDLLEEEIARQREGGVYLSVLSFGRGNLNDELTQRLAQNGNGNAAYIGSLLEAKKVLVDELGGTLFPIANDVKIQVEFNPAQVAEYRLLGYETRILAREDFDNDTVDAGEIGNGHNVTAIYEIVPVTAQFRWLGDLRYDQAPALEPDDQFSGELAYLKIRYKLPGEDISNLISRPISDEQAVASLEEAPGDVRFSIAVAAYGQLLRNDAFLQTYDFDDVVDLANASRGKDSFGYRAEFVRLADLAGTLDNRWSSLNE
jgi:Ca-activated chloride channel family protein